MARGAAKQKSKSTAPITPARRPGTSAARPKPTPGANDMTMFFPRLRKQAKWVFVFLAVIFMASFIFLGVGSGSSGISDILDPSQWFGGGGGPSASSLKKKADEHPNDARAQLDYAQQLDTDGKPAQAILVLEAFSKRNPKNADVLNDLSARYENQAQQAYNKAQLAQIDSQSISGGALVPQLTNKDGATAIPDPIVDAVSAKSQEISIKAQTDAQAAIRNDVRVLTKLVALNPGDTSTIFRLAEAASANSQTALAIANYRRFLREAPDAPEAALAKSRIKELQNPQAGPVIGG